MKATHFRSKNAQNREEDEKSHYCNEISCSYRLTSDEMQVSIIHLNTLTAHFVWVAVCAECRFAASPSMSISLIFANRWPSLLFFAGSSAGCSADGVYHPNFVPRHLKLHVWQQCCGHLVTPRQLVPKGHPFFSTVHIDDCVLVVTELIRNLGDQTHLSPIFHDIIHSVKLMKLSTDYRVSKYHTNLWPSKMFSLISLQYMYIALQRLNDVHFLSAQSASIKRKQWLFPTWGWLSCALSFLAIDYGSISTSYSCYLVAVILKCEIMCYSEPLKYDILKFCAIMFAKFRSSMHITYRWFSARLKCLHSHWIYYSLALIHRYDLQKYSKHYTEAVATVVMSCIMNKHFQGAMYFQMYIKISAFWITSSVTWTLNCIKVDKWWLR